MADVPPPVTDEEAAEEAEQALATVDSEFGRTTDPVRMLSLIHISEPTRPY